MLNRTIRSMFVAVAAMATMFVGPVSTAGANPAQGDVLQTVTGLGSSPTRVAFDGTHLWVLINGPSPSVQEVSTSGTLMSSVALTQLEPSDIVANADGVYVVDGTDLVVIDPSSATITRSIDVAGANVAGAAALEGSNVWVTYATQTASFAVKVDPTTGSVGTSVPVGNQPANAFAAGGYLFVSNYQDATITQIDTSSNAVVRTITANSFPSGDAPFGLYSDGTDVWVADNGDGDGHTVTEYDVATGAVVRVITVQPSPRLLTSDSCNIWVSEQGNNSVDAFDATSGVIPAGSPYAVGTAPEGIVYDSVDSAVWVVNSQEKSLTELAAPNDQCAKTTVTSTTTVTLPFTGVNTSGLLWAIGVLGTLGCALLLLSRRRGSTTRG